MHMIVLHCVYSSLQGYSGPAVLDLSHWLAAYVQHQCTHTCWLLLH